MSDATVAAARAMVGVPFRLHGRCAQSGVDCVGLVLLAARAAGHEGRAPDRYALRGGTAAGWAAAMARAGLVPVEEAQAGDVVLVQAGPIQFHLMLCVEGGFVHAHAGLRRVVEMPGPSPWPVIGQWRIG